MMLFFYWLSGAFACAFIALAIKYKRRDIDVKGLVGSITQALDDKTNAIRMYQNKLILMEFEATQNISRIKELEDGIQKDFGIKVRQDITNIKTDFSKLEMIIMLSGVNALLSNSKSKDDAVLYIKLFDKLQSYIDKLEDDE